MKKYLILLLPLVAMLNSCRKMDGADVGGIDTYQPLTAGSYWKYKATGIVTGTSVLTITGATATFNNKTYHTATNTSSQYNGVETSYYYAENHVYSLRSATLVSGLTVDMIYLKDNLPAGSTWTSGITDNGLVNGVPGQIVGTIVEINTSKTVSGKVFNNVIHTKLDLQYNYGSGFTSTAIYDFFVAENIGVIETDSSLSLGLGGAGLTSASVLTDYSIK